MIISAQKLAIVGGSLGYHGAAVLATRAAQRAQPGLVTLFTQENVYHAVAAQLQSAMVKLWTPDIKLLEDASGALIGPGLAALDWLAAQQTMARNAVRVVTPHLGEAARMLNTTVAWVQADRRVRCAKSRAGMAIARWCSKATRP